MLSSFVSSLLAFIVVVGILVTVHEFGHFWVARRLGVKILRFSIGFGKPLYKWYDKLGTEYVIAAIPLGGYVKMLDESQGKLSEADQAHAFNLKPLASRAAIVLAGPVFNFIFAIFAFWVLYMIGIKGLAPVLGAVEPDSVAAQSGLVAGQEILAVDGTKTVSWQGVRMAALKRAGETGTLSITATAPDALEGTEPRTYDVVLNEPLKVDEDSFLAGLGLKLKLDLPAVLGEIAPGEPAAQAGLLSGDTVIAVDGQEIDNWTDWVTYVQNSPGTPIAVSFLRDGDVMQRTVTPLEIANDEGGMTGFVGITLDDDAWGDATMRTERYSPFAAVGMGVVRTWELSALSLNMLYKMVKGAVGLNNISGPITIAKGASMSAQSGFTYFLGFLALVSVSLGVINLLPIPMLDGGHLFYYLIEAVTGKPVSFKVQQIGYSLGIFFLIGLTGLALFNDLLRL